MAIELYHYRHQFEGNYGRFSTKGHFFGTPCIEFDCQRGLVIEKVENCKEEYRKKCREGVSKGE